jgi:hypothetical protein
MARVYETFIVLFLLAVVVLGMTYVMSALIDKEQSNIYRLLSKLASTFNTAMTFCFAFNCVLFFHAICMFYVADLWSYYLPFLYSCISFIGVLMLLCK